MHQTLVQKRSDVFIGGGGGLQFVEKKVFNKKDFTGALDDHLWFPAARKGTKMPWMSREMMWRALDRDQHLFYAYETPHRK